ncbi:hypothetical protein ISS312_01396 [Alteromonas mediterranea]|jgi:hypothetical protein|nr:hypothetical protein ISS312_01396 [Alteromonas mediterranea]
MLIKVGFEIKGIRISIFSSYCTCNFLSDWHIQGTRKKNKNNPSLTRTRVPTEKTSIIFFNK